MARKISWLKRSSIAGVTELVIGRAVRYAEGMRYPDGGGLPAAELACWIR
jgi:hypothetical protein